MALFWICISVLVAGALSADDSCPPPEDITPCTCDGEGFNCMKARSVDEIRRAFRANFKYGGVRSVWVQGTAITDLPGDLFGNVKSQQFWVEVNDIATVDLNAFSASRDSMNTLSFFGNKIKDFPFSDLQMYKNLGVLNLGKNLIETIPERAFQNENLHSIILAYNRISQIGMNAFTGLTRLGRLEMSVNLIETLGPMSMALRTHEDGLQINLSGNKIHDVADSAFTGVDPYAIFFSDNLLTSLKKDAFSVLITKIAQKGGFMEVSGNPFNCKGCDYSWLELNKDLLSDRLIGFTCSDGKSLQDLTKSNIECHH